MHKKSALPQGNSAMLHLFFFSLKFGNDINCASLRVTKNLKARRQSSKHTGANVLPRDATPSAVLLRQIDRPSVCDVEVS